MPFTVMFDVSRIVKRIFSLKRKRAKRAVDSCANWFGRGSSFHGNPKGELRREKAAFHNGKMRPSLKV